MDKIERVLDAVEDGLTATVGKNWEITNVDCPDDGVHFNVVAWGLDKDMPKPEEVTLRGKQLQALKTLIDYNWNDEAKSYAESGLTLDKHIFGQLNELATYIGVNRG